MRELGENLEALPEILEQYEQALEDYKNNLKIDGKTLKNANVEQAAWLAYYDERKVELRTLVKLVEARLNKKRGALWMYYTENYQRELGPKDKEHYINHDEKFYQMCELYFTVEELYKRYESVVEAFRARGFALRNITEVHVHSLEDITV